MEPHFCQYMKEAHSHISAMVQLGHASAMPYAIARPCPSSAIYRCNSSHTRSACTARSLARPHEHGLHGTQLGQATRAQPARCVARQHQSSSIPTPNSSDQRQIGQELLQQLSSFYLIETKYETVKEDKCHSLEYQVPKVN